MGVYALELADVEGGLALWDAAQSTSFRLDVCAADRVEPWVEQGHSGAHLAAASAIEAKAHAHGGLVRHPANRYRERGERVPAINRPYNDP